MAQRLSKSRKQSPRPESLDPRLVALVKALARQAAEEDYAASRNTIHGSTLDRSASDTAGSGTKP